MEVGDIVKPVETMATMKSDGKTVFLKTNERFVVLNSIWILARVPPPQGMMRA